MGSPLKNIVVLDLSRLLPGPLCSLFLADLGAEVIKIEDTDAGDYIRWLPPLLDDYGAVFHALNRNKKSIRLNLKTPEGKDIFKRMAKKADVLLESFRPGTMDRLGLGYTELKKINPRIIYCAITGYGQDGPYRDRAGHDINYISIAGLLGANGTEGGPPQMPGVQIADIGGGSLLGLSGILLALYQRERTRNGQFLDTSMTDGCFTFLMHHLAESAGRRSPFRRGGERLTGGLACYQVYKTKDNKYISLGALEPKFWAAVLKIIGKEDLINKQFIEEEQIALKNELKNIFLTKTRDEWLALFEGQDVCCEPVYEPEEAEQDKHIKARGIFRRFKLKNGAETLQIRTPIRGSMIKERKFKQAPGYGEHTESILKKLGYSKKEILLLRNKGII
jgi:crotonobetainyl-CoA:carnitine CoA-transferase CaiB-like acyl-CoA transferase